VVPVFSPAQWVIGLLESAVSDRHAVVFHLFLNGGLADPRRSTPPSIDEPTSRSMARAQSGGVSRTWNDGILLSYEQGADVVIVSNDDILFSTGDIDRIAGTAYQQRDRDIVSCAGPHGRRERRLSSHGYACFAVNPIALDRLGCFDENFYPAYCEDQDYARRAALCGLDEANCGDTVVFHAGSTAIFADRRVWPHDRT
jgi:GT2 family glycosyltransferase